MGYDGLWWVTTSDFPHDRTVHLPHDFEEAIRETQVKQQDSSGRPWKSPMDWAETNLPNSICQGRSVNYLLYMTVFMGYIVYIYIIYLSIYIFIIYIYIYHISHLYHKQEWWCNGDKQKYIIGIYPPVSSNAASWEISELNGGFHRKIIYKWWIFHCHVWLLEGKSMTWKPDKKR